MNRLNRLSGIAIKKSRLRTKPSQKRRHTVSVDEVPQHAADDHHRVAPSLGSQAIVDLGVLFWGTFFNTIAYLYYKEALLTVSSLKFFVATKEENLQKYLEWP